MKFWIVYKALAIGVSLSIKNIFMIASLATPNLFASLSSFSIIHRGKLFYPKTANFIKLKFASLALKMTQKTSRG